MKTSKVLQPHVVLFSHYNKQRFDGKNKDEITILQHNLVRFLHFSPITIDNLNLNPQKNVKIHRKYLCKFSFCNFFEIQHIWEKYWEILHILLLFSGACDILKSAQYNFLDYFSRKPIGLTLWKMFDFWLFLKKIDRGNPMENVWFLAIFEENR